MKIDICRGDDLQTFYPSEEETDRTCWTNQTHSGELNCARRGTFHELNSLSLVPLTKSLTLGLDLRLKILIKDIFQLRFRWTLGSHTCVFPSNSNYCNRSDLCAFVGGFQMKVLIKVMFARHSSDNCLQVHFIRAETVPNAMSIIFPLYHRLTMAYVLRFDR